MPKPRTDDEENEKYPAGMAELTGQVTELAGILTDDDELIAQGKTAQAGAIEQAIEG